MTADTQDRHDRTFWVGLLAGTLVGTGLALYFLPQAARLRQGITDAARDMTTSASDRYRQASTRLEEAVDDRTASGQPPRPHVAISHADGAQAAERVAAASGAPGPIAVVKP